MLFVLPHVMCRLVSNCRKQLRHSKGASFGNRICGIKFGAEHRERALASWADNEDAQAQTKPLTQPFGIKYSFWLEVSRVCVPRCLLLVLKQCTCIVQDAIDDCPEYLVHMPTFKK